MTRGYNYFAYLQFILLLKMSLIVSPGIFFENISVAILFWLTAIFEDIPLHKMTLREENRPKMTCHPMKSSNFCSIAFGSSFPALNYQRDTSGLSRVLSSWLFLSQHCLGPSISDSLGASTPGDILDTTPLCTLLLNMHLLAR